MTFKLARNYAVKMELIPDFREPDNIRLGLSPLYTSFQDVWKCVDRIRQMPGKSLPKAWKACWSLANYPWMEACAMCAVSCLWPLSPARRV